MRKQRERANGEGSIYKRVDRRPDGTERVRWVAAVPLGNGRRQRVTCDSQREARQALNKGLDRRDRGFRAGTDRQTVAEYLDSWLRNTVRCRPTTLVGYEILVYQHIVPELGHIELGKLAPEDVEHAMKQRVAAGASPSRVNAMRALLRAALNVAVERETVYRNAARLARPLQEPEREEIDPLSPEDCRTFLDALKDDRLGALYLMGMALGLRQGEILGLQWADVDRRGNLIRVRQQLQPIRGEDGKLRLELVPLKSRRARREVPLPPSVLERLDDHRKQQLTERMLAGGRWQKSDFVFTTRFGGPIWNSNLRVAFARALKRAGMDPERFHALRHGYSSILAALGVHPMLQMELMGHARIQTTVGYTHQFAETRAHIADQVDRLLWGQA